MRAKIRLGILGDPAVLDGEHAAVVTNRRQSRLLVGLLLSPSGLTHDQAAERLWHDGERPDDPTPSIRTYANRLRQHIGDPEGRVIVTQPGGYLLDTDSVLVDADEFEVLVRIETEELDPARRRELSQRALDLWRGPAYGELGEIDWVQPEAVRLEELRLVATENLLRAELDLGRHAEVVARTERLLVDHPYREGLREVQIIGLYRSDRQVEALRAVEEHRSRLVEELGVDASPNLRRLEHLVLTQDPSLDMVGGMGRPLRGYRLRELVGSGAVSLVYRGRQPSVGRDVAVKVIRSELANRPRFVARFQAEAQTIARLEHPHIVPLYDYWREPDRAYLVMRLLPTNLADLAADGDVDPTTALRIVDQVASALEHAHRSGVVHRDVKPGNILLDYEGNAFLSDFGIAVDELVAVESEIGVTSSSEEYRAPEYQRGDPVTEASDIYAFGLVVNELLSDRGPEVERVLARACAADPAERFSSPRNMAHALRVAMEGPSPGEAKPIVVGETPYRGLSPFAEGDAGVFFGRDGPVDEILEWVEAGSNLVSVVGASGSGKTSLVLAGVVPRLRSGDLDGSEDWLVAAMRPGSDPIRALASALESLATDHDVDFMRSLSESSSGLVEVARHVMPEGVRLVVVVDQLEELYSVCDDPAERDHFLRLLSEVVGDGGRISVITTLRADFYHRPLEHPVFAGLFGRSVVTLGPMDADEITAAIVRPAAVVGAEVEPALTSALVNETLARPGALPLLQYTLAELFDQRQGSLLTFESYRELGGIAGALTERAEQFYKRLDAARQRGLSNLLARLVVVSGGVPTRRRVLVADLTRLEGVDEEMIEGMGAARLLTFDHDPESREPVAEISHEALLVEWPRLARWISERGGLLASIRRLGSAREEWERSGRSDDYLLTGDRLAAFAELGNSGILTSDEASYLTRSVETEESTRRRRTRTRLLVGSVVAFVAIVAVAFSVLAGIRQRTADEAAARQAFTRLVNLSLEESERSLDLGLLLAVEAYRRDPGPEATSALLTALSRVPAGTKVFTEPAHTGEPMSPFCGSSSPEPGRFLSVSGEPGDPQGELVLFDVINGQASLRTTVPFTCGARMLADGRFIGRIDGTDFDFREVIVDPDGRLADLSAEVRRVFTLLSDGRLFAETTPETPGGSGDLVLLDPNTGDVIGQVGLNTVEFTVDPTERYALMQEFIPQATDDGQPEVHRGIVDLATYEVTPLERDINYEWVPGEPGPVAIFDTTVLRFDVSGALIGEANLTTVGGPQLGHVFSPGGSVLAVATEGGVELFSYPELESLAGPFEVAEDLAGLTVIDDHTFATQARDGVVTLWDANAPGPLVREIPFGAFNDTLFMSSPEYGFVWLGEFDDRYPTDFLPVSLPEAEIFDPYTELGVDPDAEVHPLVDGRWMVYSANGIALVDGSGREILDVTPPEGVEGLGASFEGAHVHGLDAIDFDGEIPSKVLITNVDVRRGELARMEIEVSGWVGRPETGAGGFWVQGEGGAVLVYDWGGQEMERLAAEMGNGSRLSADGSRLALVGQDRSLSVYDLGTGNLVAELAADSHYEPPLFAGSDRLVARSRDGEVVLWDLTTAQRLGTLAMAPDAPPGVGGFAGASGGYDATLARDGKSIWFTQDQVFVEVTIDPERWLTAACEAAGRSLTEEEWAELVPYEEPYRDACSDISVG